MDSRSELAGHLSGNLADYKFISSKPGEITIVPLHNYEGRGKSGFEERIIWLEENVRVLLQDKAILEQGRVALKREHLYKKLCVGLHDLWWPQLTNATRTTIVQYGPGNLPSIFYSWWLQWHEVDPVQFPLPPTIRHFGPAHVDYIRFIHDSATLGESTVSRAVGVAWATVSENDRQLMLLCWSGFRAFRVMHNKIARLGVTKTEATEILGCDIAESFQNLHSIAYVMADGMFSD